jgi:glycosyltransferase involved in cell wall biosynthesis
MVDKIYFHGELKQREIYNLYHKLDNRIFIFTSLSETFGKTPMEAGICGVPIFIKKSDITPILYTHEENAYIFDNRYDFKVLLYKFLKSGINEKKSLIENSVKNIKKYDQNIIFNNLLKFLIQSDSKLKILLNFFDIFAFHSMSKMVNCSGMFLGEQ